MLYSKFLYALALVPMARAAVPTLTKLFDGTLFLADPTARATSGPFGTRVLIGFTGGNLTDPNDGQVLASILPGVGGELGLLGSNNVFYPDVRMGLQWVDDGTFAYLELHGSGPFPISSTSYARFETNSSLRADLNGRFTILRIVLGDFNPSTFEIFALLRICGTGRHKKAPATRRHSVLGADFNMARRILYREQLPLLSLLFLIPQTH